MTVLRRPLGAAVAVAVAAVGLTLGVGGTAHADSSCENEVSSVAASDLTADVTWAQQLFNMKRVWPMATGDGVTVAVWIPVSKQTIRSWTAGSSAARPTSTQNHRTKRNRIWAMEPYAIV